ncbi:MAG: ABC transporter ATP-binding protein [Alphaproteobacteria bacterium]|nr:ABC transporter ATP-binding protein [Alphaproteobacteria bacterium]
MSIARRIGAALHLRGLTKRYGDVLAADNVDLEVRPGELLTLLGPSGSGKTTLLMMLAGFTEPTDGAILVDGKDVSALPPHRRNIGVVFQHYALFPHMTVAENIAFPLQMRGQRGEDVARKVREALELVQMPQMAARFPAQLSGGQQQRVAFARAIVFDPPVLLLDEPLGALDRKLRDAMQIELKQLHARLGLTMIYVTHDQSEALALSDRIAVVEAGRIAQLGTPRELYETPRSSFVADFLGESNFISATLRSSGDDVCRAESSDGLALTARPAGENAVGSPIHIVVRPERILVGDESASLANRFVGSVEDVSYVGEAVRYRVRLGAALAVTAKVQNRGAYNAIGAAPTTLAVGWSAEDSIVFARSANAPSGGGP